MPQPVICRFAPSPTGLLHHGNGRVALFNYLYAKQHNGQFILRIDDTDEVRSKTEYATAIIQDLKWLGLTYDQIFYQHERLSYYQQAVQQLKTEQRLYPCYETFEELELMRKSLESRGLPPIYNRQALQLTKTQLANYQAEGRQPHWRFLLLDKTIQWQDGNKGLVSFQSNLVSDPVLVKSNGQPLYTLSSVVDDGLLKISMIIRGDDHLTNTAAQTQLFEALGYPLPLFTHLPRMVDNSGGKLSKRLGATPIRDYRQAQLHPLSLLNYWAHMGLDHAATGREQLTDLIANFNLNNYSRAEPKFTETELWALNNKLVSHLTLPQAKEFFGAEIFTQPPFQHMDETLWRYAANSIKTREDFAQWQTILSNDFTPSHQFNNMEKKILTAACQLPLPNIDNSKVMAWLKTLAGTTNCSGKELFQPIRLALTDQDHGPTIFELMTLITKILGPAEITKRLQRAAQ